MRRIALVLTLVILIPAVTLAKDEDRKLAAAYEQYSGKTHKEDCTGGLCASTLTEPSERLYVLMAACGKNSSPSYCAVLKELTPTLRVVALDHATSSWKAYTLKWTADGPAPIESASLERDDDGNPQLVVARRHPYVVVVENTNPLLYAMAKGKRTNTPIEQMAGLKKLVAGIASGATALLESKKDDLDALGSIGIMKGPKFEFGKPFEIAIEAAEHIRWSLQDVGTVVTAVADRQEEISDFIQAVEINETDDIALEAAGISYVDVRSAFDELESAQEKMQQVAGCLGGAQRLQAVLQSDTARPKATIDAVDALEVELRTGACSGDVKTLLETARQILKAAVTEEYRALQKGEKELARLGGKGELTPDEAKEKKALAARLKNGSAGMAEAIGTISNEIGDAVASYARIGTALAGLKRDVDDLAGKRGATLKAAVQLQSFASELATWRVVGLDREKVASAEIARFLLIGAENAPDWEKQFKQPFIVSRRGDVSEHVLATRTAPLNGSYGIVAAGSRLWDVSASLIHTDVDSPTYAAVENPANDTKFIIGRTDEERISGKTALFFEYALIKALCAQCRWLDHVGLQLGSTLGNDQPAFFAGGTMRIGRYLRLGGGYAYVRVEGLNDQHEGEELPNAGALRKKKVFEDGTYLSLNISLGSLSFFNTD